MIRKFSVNSCIAMRFLTGCALQSVREYTTIEQVRCGTKLKTESLL